MGDLLKSNPIFAKLGFDESNQWILYADGMQDFFNWMANNITEDNIASDAELHEANDWKAKGQWCEDEDLENRLAEMEKKYPGILTYTDKDVTNMKNELKLLEDVKKHYVDLNAKIDQTKTNLNREISDLELAVYEAEVSLEKSSSTAIEKAKQLQELQKTSMELNEELRSCFTEPQTPPLFIHEMPLDDYFRNCDLFQRYLTTYLSTNLKTTTEPESSDSEEKINQTIDELKNLERQLYGAELKLVQAKAQEAGYRNMIKQLDISKVHAMTPSQLKNEIQELSVTNQHLLESFDPLMNELKTILKTLSEQQVECILYENTKTKLQRASQRLETVKSLSKHVSDVLTNAELLWILMQFDLEKVKNFCDNSTCSPIDVNACNRRIEAMLQYKSIPADFHLNAFVNRMADQLVSFLPIQRPTTAKACFYEYERFCRLSNNTLKGIVNKKYYNAELKQLEELKSVEKIYSAYVYDGPVKGPSLENVKFLEPIYEANRSKEELEKAIRRVRCDIQANITDKMNSDRFWRYQQLLWIWFLTEPKKVIQAIEEAKKAASQVPSVKMLAGIKRKENEN